MQKLLTKIRAFSHIQQMTLLSACLLAVLGLLYKFAALPLLAASAANQELLQRERSQLALYRSFAAHIDAQGTDRQLAGRLQELEQALPPQLDVNAAMEAYYALAAESAVQLTGCTAGKAQAAAAGEAVTVLPVHLSFQGEYFAVLHFIQALENGTHYVSFASMQLHSSEDDGLIHAVGVLNLYALQEKMESERKSPTKGQ